jgi:ferritin-like metal-binding protein YciE
VGTFLASRLFRHQEARAFAAGRRSSTNPSGKETDMTVNTLNDLFVETLRDLYYVEKKLVKTLPKMAQKASSEDLKEAIQSHLAETEIHVKRLEQVFELLDQKASGKTCEAIEGLIREAEEVMGEIADEQTLDAAIISSAQTVEHYEIARYGTLACWAAEIGNSEVAELLEQTLEEEKTADEKLSEIAEDAVNQRAAA